MGINEILFIFAMLIGMLGIIVPMLPGLGFMFVAILVYGFFDHWASFSWGYAILIGFITFICSAIDYIASGIGAKKYGASKLGIIAAVLSGFLGFIVLNIVGLFLGALIGIICAELYQKKSVKQSLTAATGILVGNMIGMGIQFVVGIGIFIISILKLF